MPTAIPIDRKEANPAMIHSRKLSIAIGAALAACLTTPALAASGPSTRLVSCHGSESCLLVTGHRDSAGSTVRINGHPVDVKGQRNWRVRLPMATVRDWTVPYARRIEVSYDDTTGRQAVSHYTKLPIGLLGHAPDLASLVITLN